MNRAITHRAAVLGSPIGHSRSPLLHNTGYRAAGLEHWSYGRFECIAEQLPELIGALDNSYRGFSVTMPAKFAALDFATERTDRAERIGSANTLVRIGEGVHAGWRADNTDVDGVFGALAELDVSASLMGAHATVIGGGGTARPVLWALASLGVTQVTVVNRTDRSEELAPLVETHGGRCTFVSYEAALRDLAKQSAVLVSTVPSAAIQDHVQDLAHTSVFDVIYEPWPTPLVTQTQRNGHKAVGGHVMLANQAYGQFEQFTGVPAPREAMWQALINDLH